MLTSICSALSIARATVYRRRWPAVISIRKPRPASFRKLSTKEEFDILHILHSKRFIDRAPGEVYATLLDEGRYYGSERTMYRILARHGEVKERRDVLRHPPYAAPELLATGPNQVWSWDITKLRGPEKHIFYYLYVILDIYSRCVTGWTLADCECDDFAKTLFEETILKYDIPKGQLQTHSDRGAVMRSKTLGDLFIDLGVKTSFSRPRVSNDNCYSESQFKTLKYAPSYPHRFGSLQDAKAYIRTFLHWYNCEHRHSGIGWMTPHSLHFGSAHHLYQKRSQVLHSAYAQFPHRFVNKPPVPPNIPTHASINLPLPLKPSLVLQ